MNNYDLEHVCTAHPIMSKEAWQKVYRDAWSQYYTDQHVETVLRRAWVSGFRMSKVYEALTYFSSAVRIEDVHPLQLGIARRIVRTQRRYGMPIANPLRFYPWRAAKLAAEVASWLWLWRRYRAIARRIEKDPDAKNYTDRALAPVPGDPVKDHLVELFADKLPKTYGAPLREPVAM